MNCQPGDFAIVVGAVWGAPPGTIVKVNLCAKEHSMRTGIPTWDVESRDGNFFVAEDHKLCRLTGAFDRPYGFHDELFAPHWIYTDGGKPRMPEPKWGLK
jgi:hypothetical protein